MLWSGAVFATIVLLGPQAYIDSATDDGGGKIRVSWSLQSKPEGHTFRNDVPGKVCVYWAVVEDGERKTGTNTCFTSETSNQDDLLVDTGIGGDGSKTVYALLLTPYYNGLPVWAEDTSQRTEVTLNANN